MKKRALRALRNQYWKRSDIGILRNGLRPALAMQTRNSTTRLRPIAHPTPDICNSKRVPFFTSYPNQRFQIILKNVRRPREVLLKLNLGICTVGYRKGVRNLPPMLRALESTWEIIMRHTWLTCMYQRGTVSHGHIQGRSRR